MQPSSEPDADLCADETGVPLNGAETDGAAPSSSSVILRLLDEGGRRLVEDDEAEVVELMEISHRTDRLVSVGIFRLLIC